jgi:phytoene dehydrogenase-like protein
MSDRYVREHDVLVVGGGHNGLVAGCYLARAGLDVLVIERNKFLGGMSITMPLVDEAPAHLLSPGAYEDVYLRASGVVEDLGLARHGFREIDAAGWAWLGADGSSMVFRSSVDDTARDIARFSRADAERYRELMAAAVSALALQERYGSSHPQRPGAKVLVSVIRSLVGDRRLRSLLASLFTSTAADAVSSTFASTEVRGAFASIATILGSPFDEGSALALLGPAALHHLGAGRPIGGMGALVASLERCLRSHGGGVRTGNGVTAIKASSGRADAVELDDGTIIRVRRAVVAAIPPQRVPDLVGDALDATIAERMRAAPANASGIATLTVNVALSGRLELPQHQAMRHDGLDLRRPTLFTGSFEEVLTASRQAARGELPTAPTWWMAIFTAMDPSQAPEGQDVAQLYSPVPAAPIGGWPAVRAQAAESLVRTISATAPRLPDLEIGRYVETPDDLTARTGTLRGSLYHVDHVPTRMGPLRPALGAGGYRTPLPGLYLSGAGTHPQGGVSGLPGKLSAQTVLHDSPYSRAPRLLRRASSTNPGAYSPNRATTTGRATTHAT